MKKKARPESFMRQPKYPGGKKALDEFIRTNLQYPEEALKNKVEGSVTVKYDVDVFGKVSNTAITHGIGYGCDEEALRLVKLLKYEKKKYQGLRVTFHQTIVIHFHLTARGVKPQQQQEIKIHYQYTENNSPKASEGKISYTIVPGKK
jgi:TonB family protein